MVVDTVSKLYLFLFISMIYQNFKDMTELLVLWKNLYQILDSYVHNEYYCIAYTIMSV